MARRSAKKQALSLEQLDSVQGGLSLVQVAGNVHQKNQQVFAQTGQPPVSVVDELHNQLGLPHPQAKVVTPGQQQIGQQGVQVVTQQDPNLVAALQRQNTQLAQASRAIDVYRQREAQQNYYDRVSEQRQLASLFSNASRSLLGGGYGSSRGSYGGSRPSYSGGGGGGGYSSGGGHHSGGGQHYSSGGGAQHYSSGGAQHAVAHHSASAQRVNPGQSSDSGSQHGAGPHDGTGAGRYGQHSADTSAMFSKSSAKSDTTSDGVVKTSTITRSDYANDFKTQLPNTLTGKFDAKAQPENSLVKAATAAGHDLGSPTAATTTATSMFPNATAPSATLVAPTNAAGTLLNGKSVAEVTAAIRNGAAPLDPETQSMQNAFLARTETVTPYGLRDLAVNPAGGLPGFSGMSRVAFDGTTPPLIPATYNGPFATNPMPNGGIPISYADLPLYRDVAGLPNELGPADMMELGANGALAYANYNAYNTDAGNYAGGYSQLGATNESGGNAYVPDGYGSSGFDEAGFTGDYLGGGGNAGGAPAYDNADAYFGEANAGATSTDYGGGNGGNYAGANVSDDAMPAYVDNGGFGGQSSASTEQNYDTADFTGPADNTDAY